MAEERVILTSPVACALDSFSVRHGHEPKREPQVDTMDDDLRRRITDVIYDHFEEIPVKQVWTGWIKLPLIELASKRDHLLGIVMDKCNKTTTHHEMYTLVEIIVRNISECYRDEFIRDMNGVLAENMSAWRIEGDTVVRVMGEAEAGAVRGAASISEENDRLSKGALKAMGPSDPNFETSIMLSAKMVENTLDMIGGYGKGVASKLESVAGAMDLPGDIVKSFKRMNSFANEFARHPHDQDTYRDDRNDAMVILVWSSAMSTYLHDRWADRERLAPGGAGQGLGAAFGPGGAAQPTPPAP